MCWHHGWGNYGQIFYLQKQHRQQSLFLPDNAMLGKHKTATSPRTKRKQPNREHGEVLSRLINLHMKQGAQLEVDPYFRVDLPEPIFLRSSTVRIVESLPGHSFVKQTPMKQRCDTVMMTLVFASLFHKLNGDDICLHYKCIGCFTLSPKALGLIPNVHSL